MIVVPTVLKRRFAADLDPLHPPGLPLGVAVSGGPDSLALLLLAAAVRPGEIRAATVDHGLRPASGEEAEMVAALCDRLAVPHSILPADWAEAPSANIQAEARNMRYRRLCDWAQNEGLPAIATAHHADDQAETLLMRLARGSGVGGLAGVRASRALAEDVRLVRPLLGWRKAELVELVGAAGIEPVDDPSNRDPAHDRVRFRRIVEQADWLDPARLSATASALRDADEALDWATAPLMVQRIERKADLISVDPSGLPGEIRRRLLLAALAQLGIPAPRGPDLARAMTALAEGRTVTLADIKLEGGPTWRLSPAPPRRG